jgi:hypothetical protein
MGLCERVSRLFRRESARPLAPALWDAAELAGQYVRVFVITLWRGWVARIDHRVREPVRSPVRRQLVRVSAVADAKLRRAPWSGAYSSERMAAR